MIDKEKTWKVYRFWIEIDGQEWSYIGCTSQTLASRARKDGRDYLRCPKFGDAIRKYGWENFNREILVETDQEDLAWSLEQKYIKIFDSINNGFNTSTGGKSGSKGCSHGAPKGAHKGISFGGGRRPVPVFQLDLNGVLLNEFSSLKEAAEKTHTNLNHICDCCAGRARTAGGYKWAKHY